MGVPNPRFARMQKFDSLYDDLVSWPERDLTTLCHLLRQHAPLAILYSPLMFAGTGRLPLTDFSRNCFEHAASDLDYSNDIADVIASIRDDGIRAIRSLEVQQSTAAPPPRF
jgi:hypothetical protein